MVARFCLASLALIAATAALTRAAEPQPVPPQQLPLMPLVKSFPLDKDHTWTRVAVSPSGDLLATLDEKSISVWNWSTGKVIWSKPVGIADVRHLQFSPTGKFLLTSQFAGNLNSVFCINAADGAEIKHWPISGIGISDMAMSPDEKILLVTRNLALYHQNSLGISCPLLLPLENADPRGVTDATGMPTFSSSVAWLPDGKHFMLDAAALGDAETGQLADRSPGLGVFGGAWSAISPDGQHVVKGTQKSLALYSIAPHKELWHISLDYAFFGEFGGGTFIGNDQILTWASDIRLWDTRTGQEISWANERPTSGANRNDIKTVISASFGKNIVAGIDGRALKIWSLPNPNQKVQPDPRWTHDLGPAAEGDFGMPGDLPRVIALLARGANPKAGVEPDGSGPTALHVAGTAQITRALLDAGADPNASSESTSTSGPNFRPLHNAIERFRTGASFEQIDLLIERGAKLEQTVGESTPLQMAVTSRKPDLARHLIAKGAYFDIFSATMLDDLARVAALLKENPALIDTTMAYTKQTPLFFARSAAMVDLLRAARR